MNELVFLVGLTVGIIIGVPALAKLWRVDLRGARFDPETDDAVR